MIIHKYAHKFCFKGSWDATGKLVKGTILKNELKNDRCANAVDCFHKLKRDLTKDGTNKKQELFKEWERTGNKKIL